METYKYILDDLAQRFGVVIDWTSENVMPQIEQLCTEIVAYKTTMYLSAFIALAILTVITIIIWTLYFIGHIPCLSDDDIWCGIIGILFTTLPLVLATLYFIEAYIKTQTAPSLVVIDYLNSLIR